MLKASKKGGFFYALHLRLGLRIPKDQSTKSTVPPHEIFYYRNIAIWEYLRPHRFLQII